MTVRVHMLVLKLVIAYRFSVVSRALLFMSSTSR